MQLVWVCQDWHRSCRPGPAQRTLPVRQTPRLMAMQIANSHTRPVSYLCRLKRHLQDKEISHHLKVETLWGL